MFPCGPTHTKIETQFANTAFGSASVFLPDFGRQPWRRSLRCSHENQRSKFGCGLELVLPASRRAKKPEKGPVWFWPGDRFCCCFEDQVGLELDANVSGCKMILYYFMPCSCTSTARARKRSWFLGLRSALGSSECLRMLSSDTMVKFLDALLWLTLEKDAAGEKRTSTQRALEAMHASCPAQRLRTCTTHSILCDAVLGRCSRKFPTTRPAMALRSEHGPRTNASS